MGSSIRIGGSSSGTSLRTIVLVPDVHVVAGFRQPLVGVTRRTSLLPVLRGLHASASTSQWGRVFQQKKACTTPVPNRWPTEAGSSRRLSWRSRGMGCPPLPHDGHGSSGASQGVPPILE